MFQKIEDTDKGPTRYRGKRREGTSWKIQLIQRNLSIPCSTHLRKPALAASGISRQKIPYQADVVQKDYLDRSGAPLRTVTCQKKSAKGPT